MEQAEIILYQSEDGSPKIEVRLVDESVWLTLNQLAELFQKAKSTISEHIRHIFEEGELAENEVTVRNFRTVQNEGGRDVERALDFYNLDVIISVGYRVKSHRGTQFRIWVPTPGTKAPTTSPRGTRNAGARTGRGVLPKGKGPPATPPTAFQGKKTRGQTAEPHPTKTQRGPEESKPKRRKGRATSQKRKKKKRGKGSKSGNRKQPASKA